MKLTRALKVKWENENKKWNILIKMVLCQ